jgi:hypothetical protein
MNPEVEVDAQGVKEAVASEVETLRQEVVWATTSPLATESLGSSVKQMGWIAPTEAWVIEGLLVAALQNTEDPHVQRALEFMQREE